MANHLVLKRLGFLCSRRTYHVLGKRIRNESSLYVRVNQVLLVSMTSDRLYSTSKNNGSSGDPEMFRETPSFPPEWTNPTIDAVNHDTDAAASSELSGSVVDTIAQNPEVLTSTIGGYTPVGMLQTALEFVHTTLHLPWWLSIVSTTIAIRLALFPLAVKMQINAAKIANINPHAQVLHQQLMEYKRSGDKQAEAEQGMKLLKLYQDNDCHPLKMFIMPFAQMPIFISFFMALRGMARLPVESLKTGGTLWFTDLTVPDPTYALPLIACATFLSNVELGGEGGAANTNETHKRMKLFLRASGFLILPISITFPSALFCYWVTNSFISTAQILLFKIPAVKTALGIPKIVRSQTG